MLKVEGLKALYTNVRGGGRGLKMRDSMCYTQMSGADGEA